MSQPLAMPPNPAVNRMRRYGRLNRVTGFVDARVAAGHGEDEGADRRRPADRHTNLIAAPVGPAITTTSPDDFSWPRRPQLTSDDAENGKNSERPESAQTHGDRIILRP